jgi:hypothetical protein
VEEALVDALGVLVPAVEACGAVVIVVGALWAFVPVRLTPGRLPDLRRLVRPAGAPEPDSVRRGSITHGQDARAGVDGRGRPRVDS